MLWILIEILSRDYVKGGKGRNDFKFGTFVGRFSSDGAANLAVKGLKVEWGCVHVGPHWSLAYLLARSQGHYKTPSIPRRRYGCTRRKFSTILLWKDEKGPSSIWPTLELP